VRTNPEELIIAQEDYVALFRPNEYRQIKLALTIKESTTLILGYGLGDVNVLTALDWSKNVFKNAAANYPNGLIQVFRAASPKQKPYLDRNGIVIVEASNLEAFFDELLEVQEKYAKEYGEQQESLKQFAKELDSADKGIVDHFIDDEDFRDGVLEELSQYPIDLIAGFVSLLDKCIEETWARSSPGGAFEGYNENLVLLVDILEAFPMNKIPPALFQTVAYSLNRVSGMVAEHWGQFGKSWSAGTTWSKRKGDLKVETVKELRAVSKQHGYFGLQRLLEDLPV
jgi:hypothetical protein